MLHASLLVLERAVRQECHFCTKLSYCLEKKRVLPKLLGSHSQEIWLEFSYNPSSTEDLRRHAPYQSFDLVVKFCSADKDLDNMEEQNSEDTTAEQEHSFDVLLPYGK